MSQKLKKESGLSETPSRLTAPTISSANKRKRILPQIPASTPNDTTINLTTVTEPSSSTIDTTNTTWSKTREFVSPVKFTEGEDSSVTVAVRVRPFSQREALISNAVPIIRMHGNEVIIKSPDNIVHRFYYDHCFWSIPEDPAPRDLSPGLATQESVYRELAQPLLDRSFEGYNTCLFAYGQTGSGKSYCIMGEGDSIGIVPRFAQELFERVEGTSDEETSFKVQVSYYEIYKERIHDLLASNQQTVKKKLRVREHPVLGPYVEDLSTFVADSYSDIERWVSLGNRFRATAATGMNERSSRSHSVFTITLTQTTSFEGEDQSKVSRVNLIDLAGSERSSVSRTSGERLKEGAAINKSLHSLGKVISLLSEKSSGRRKKVFIPYRDSTLTWLLKESLGGNSKTAMIATISPSTLHYEESLSTLRYAQQARAIVNVARINEDPNAAIIRDLRQQIEELKGQLGGGRGVASPGDSSQVRLLQEKLVESEKLMAETTRSWQEKLRQSEARKQEEMELLKKLGSLHVDNKQPNLVNLTEDPQLSEIVVYFLKEGLTTVGHRGDPGNHDIQLSGALVMGTHCSINNNGGEVTIAPSANTEAQTFINGDLISAPVGLHHGDRIVLGGEYYFKLNNPLENGAHLKKGQGTFEYAKNELIRAQTARLEAELEERRLKEREALMAEIQLMRDEAQKDIDQQRAQYEDKLTRLTREMAEQSMEASHNLRSSEQAQAKMEELLQRNKALEEETMTQKHLIHLEKLKAEKDYQEIKEEKNKLMFDLEQEKNKLVADIQHLNKNKTLRTSGSRKESTLSSVSMEPSVRGSEMVRLAMMLQEASAISKSVNKPLTFSREELTDDSGSLEVQVRVSNTQGGLVTFWSQDKFEARLEMMRDLYSNLAVHGSESSLESIASGEEVDPFSDPSDSWVKESLLTPHPSPMRTSSVRSLLSSASTLSTTTLSIHPPRSILDMLNSSLASSRGSSPIAQSPPAPQQASVATLCHHQISTILSASLSRGSPPLAQLLLARTIAVRGACDDIEDAFNGISTQIDSPGTFSRLPRVSQAVLTLYTSLELLHAHGQALHREVLVSQALLTRLIPDVMSNGLVKEKADTFLETITQQAALYISRLLQAVEKESADGIKESCCNLAESLDLLTQQIGSLTLAKTVSDHMINQTTDHSDTELTNNIDFLTQQPFQKSCCLYYQGYCEWCVLVFDWACGRGSSCLDSFTHNSTLSKQSELLGDVLSVLQCVDAFLHKMAEIQVDVWSLLEQPEGTLPLTPPTGSVVAQLAALQQLVTSLQALSSQLNTEDLSANNKLVGYAVSSLAALALKVIKGSACGHSHSLSHEVQLLSHEIARAGKTLNNSLKKLGRAEKRRSEVGEQKTDGKELVQNGDSFDVSCGSRNESLGQSRTSMATGQATNEITEPDHLTDDSIDDDSTLI